MVTLVNIQPQQVEQAMVIINEAKAYLKATGIDQWQAGYPDAAQITADIASGSAYFIQEGTAILGYVYVDFAPHPVHDTIQGAWGDGERYGVIHRLAMGDAGRGRGLMGQVFALVEEKLKAGAVSMARLDAMGGNPTLLHVVKKQGFTHRGYLQLPAGERVAFDKPLM